MADTDQKLIESALTGSQNAYKQLMNRHQQAVFHIVFKIVRNNDTASDLVQETFMKAFASLATYRAEYKFSTWLYRIGANCAIDYLRKQRIRTLSLDSPAQTADGEMEFEIADESFNPERDLLNHEKRISINDAIDELPEKYRLVIIYRHKDNKTYEEISEVLDVPIGTVKARIFRARELLKKKLRPF